MFQQKLTSYVKRFSQHFNSSQIEKNYEKNFDDTFVLISLTDIEYVSLSFLEIFYSIDYKLFIYQ